MKRRIFTTLNKYVSNPPLKALFALGLVPPGFALLATIGRKSGKPRRTPVGDGLVGEQFWLVAEHGLEAGYVRNIAANPRVRIKLRQGLWTRWHAGTATLLPDDDPHARQRWLGQQRFSTWMNSLAVRGFGTRLLTIRIDLEQPRC